MMTTKSFRLIAVSIIAMLTLSIWVSPQLIRSYTYANDGIGGVASRTNLQICIANHNGAPVTGEVMSKIRTAFAKVKQHPDFERAGLNRGGGPQIRAGCPSASTLNTEKWGRNTVTTPGPIHTYVFIASAQDLQGTQFKQYPRVVGYEQMCISSQCASVANAVYLTPEELNDPQLLVRTLTAGIGLSDPQPAVPLYNDQITPDDKSKQ